ncbi:late exocytosis, associated with Golgi transport-domain-containing protein [Scenedesmus sp. NREL 46B-D3]|nr:late exocytosis, associated with Golgi transport-domain-containing protein [Scenedesmus sp. NREL 46B-D3]
MSAISGATVGVALGIDLAIGVASLLLFSVLRICRPTNRYYDPRTYYGASSTRKSAGDSAAAVHATLLQDTDGSTGGGSSSSSSTPDSDDAEAATSRTTAAAAESGHSPSLLFPSPSPLAPPGESGMPLPGAPLPPVLPKTLLTWVVPLLRLPEQRVIAAVGLDVAMLLRFIRFALKLLLVLMVWCLGVVLPVNYTGTNLAELRQAQLLAAANPAAGNSWHPKQQQTQQQQRRRASSAPCSSTSPTSTARCRPRTRQHRQPTAALCRLLAVARPGCSWAPGKTLAASHSRSNRAGLARATWTCSAWPTSPPAARCCGCTWPPCTWSPHSRSSCCGLPRVTRCGCTWPTCPAAA